MIDDQMKATRKMAIKREAKGVEVSDSANRLVKVLKGFEKNLETDLGDLLGDDARFVSIEVGLDRGMYAHVYIEYTCSPELIGPHDRDVETLVEQYGMGRTSISEKRKSTRWKFYSNHVDRGAPQHGG